MSIASSLPYFAFQLQYVVELGLLCHISLTGRPASASFRMEPISVNFDWGMRTSWLGWGIVMTSPRKTTALENESKMAASAVLDERSGSMKRSKFSEEQIVYAIRQAESGTPIGDVCRQLGVSEATFYTWKKKYAHLGVSELRRLRQVEEENSRLKRLVADLSLDKHMLSEALRKKV